MAKKTPPRQGLTHTLIVGRTMTGKTTLARHLTGIIRHHRPILIYDPLSTPGVNTGGWWGRVCSDWADFSLRFWGSRGCAVYIDEALQVWRDDPDDATRMMIQGRHRTSNRGGHTITLIAQRHIGLAPVARDQCSRLYGFRVGAGDARQLAEDYAMPALAEMLPVLLPGHYYRADTGSPEWRHGHLW